MNTKGLLPKIERARESYRGTALIARAYGPMVRGKAWCSGREIASIEGVSEDDVLVELRQLVDDAFTVESTAGSVSYPSEEAYEDAFRTNLPKLTDNYVLMLRAHCKAKKRTLTAAGLAEAAGYPTWTSANLHYGKIGRMLGEYLLFQPRLRAKGTPIWILLMAEGADAATTEDKWQWRMRDEVAAALKTLKIV